MSLSVVSEKLYNCFLFSVFAALSSMSIFIFLCGLGLELSSWNQTLNPRTTVPCSDNSRNICAFMFFSFKYSCFVKMLWRALLIPEGKMTKYFHLNLSLVFKCSRRHSLMCISISLPHPTLSLPRSQGTKQPNFSLPFPTALYLSHTSSPLSREPA